MKQLLEQQLLHTDRLQYLAAAEAIKTAAKADCEFNRECIRAQRECAKEFRRTTSHTAIAAINLSIRPS